MKPVRTERAGATDREADDPGTCKPPPATIGGMAAQSGIGREIAHDKEVKLTGHRGNTRHKSAPCGADKLIFCVNSMSMK